MVDRAALNRELKKIRHLIETRPEIKARFDADGNGVIDGEEWEAVRQLAIRRLERKAAEAEAAKAEAEAERAEVAVPVDDGTVAEQIVAQDLAPAPDAGGDLTTVDELILEQSGGLSQLVDGLFLRNYAIKTRSGRALGTIQQRDHEGLKQLTNSSAFEVPQINFALTGMGLPPMQLERKYMGMRMRIDVSDVSKGILAHCERVTSLVRFQARVHGALDAHPLVVQRPLLKPFTFNIVDSFGDKVGQIERGWSGLGGLLLGGNLTRVSLDPASGTPGRRLGLVAVALMVDLIEEDRRG